MEGGRRTDKLVDRWITGKINDSGQLIGRSSRNWIWEEDKVDGGYHERKGDKVAEVYLRAGVHG